MNPRYIIIHHSLTEDGATVSWNAITDYHVNVNGWKDVGYHYGAELVGDRYNIFKGRMDNEDGAHCIGFNDKSIGICLVGNYDISEPCEQQIALLKKLVNSLREIYGIPLENVLGHWETYGLRGVPVEKSCPGNKFSMTNFRRVL